VSHGKVVVSSKKTGEKGKLVSLSIQDKVKITEKLEAAVSVASIFDYYSIVKQTISDMKRNLSSMQ
jgi:predicted secreted Zn-dependent protease